MRVGTGILRRWAYRSNRLAQVLYCVHVIAAAGNSALLVIRKLHSSSEFIKMIKMPTDSENAEFPKSNYDRIFLEQLTNEYRIIQDKIDKQAGFRFTVRGWSVTLFVGAVLGTNALKLPQYSLLAVLVPLIAFPMMEYSQWRNHSVLSARAIRIEKAIWRIVRTSVPSDPQSIVSGIVPRLGTELGEDWNLMRPPVRWLRSHGYIFFYVAQVALVIVATCLFARQQKEPQSDPRAGQVIINDLSSGNSLR